ncbi:MAG: signal peptidase II [Veillonella sp.]|nr:signal peptidase II [Veillonella sp.]
MFYIILILWLLLDQWTKYYIMNHFMLGESLVVIPNVFHLTYIINRGAAFGSKGPWTLQIGSALLVSGAIGNGIDRYMLHGVVDFFDFRIWPIFNVADIGICVGVALVVYYLFTLKDDDK